jgi:hypothetical protein
MAGPQRAQERVSGVQGGEVQGELPASEGGIVTILRVFPRRTTATPTDDRAFIGNPPMFWPDADEVHVSVAFSWDRAEAERLACAWMATGLPVSIGGPAYDAPGGEFVTGRYLKSGYTITSRGCPNHCWFCAVPKREGGLRELAIPDGWNVVDDNLLACSESHVKAVFAMLKRQPHRAEFTGGLEAKQLKGWHVDLLADLKPGRMYFAYDTPDDLEPLRQAGAMLAEAGFRGSHNVCAYVLVGYPRDTMDSAETRLRESWAAGFWPFAMLYRDEKGETQKDWRRFQRMWTRPQIVATTLVRAAS